jgi:hypothetical protein
VAVVVRQYVAMEDRQVEIRVYLPAGGLTKEDRIRADRLDAELACRIPRLVPRLEEVARPNGDIVYRWYMLGRLLRETINDRSLVLQADVESGVIFRAVWDHLPPELRPSPSHLERPFADRQHKRKDHLSLCYEISAFKWDDVSWIRRWDDWNQVSFRPSLLRDCRLLGELGKQLRMLPAYPSRVEFRTVVKYLGMAFPTRVMRDSTLLSDERIRSAVSDAISATGLQPKPASARR